jgi:hypothetical protein
VPVLEFDHLVGILSDRDGLNGALLDVDEARAAVAGAPVA